MLQFNGDIFVHHFNPRGVPLLFFSTFDTYLLTYTTQLFEGINRLSCLRRFSRTPQISSYTLLALPHFPNTVLQCKEETDHSQYVFLLVIFVVLVCIFGFHTSAIDELVLLISVFIINHSLGVDQILLLHAVLSLEGFVFFCFFCLTFLFSP